MNQSKAGDRGEEWLTERIDRTGSHFYRTNNLARRTEVKRYRDTFAVHIIHDALTIYASARRYPSCDNIPIGPMALPIEVQYFALL